MKLKIKRMTGPLVKEPVQHHDGDAGLDLFSSGNYMVNPGTQVLIPIGYAMEIPYGFVGLIKDRSSIASKHRLYVGAGVIDSTYRGEIHVLLRNNSINKHLVEFNSKIAQMLIIAYADIDIEITQSLNPSSRGEKGFGSTGQ